MATQVNKARPNKAGPIKAGPIKAGPNKAGPSKAAAGTPPVADEPQPDRSGGDSVFRRAVRAFEARDAMIYYDLSPLRETHWTGIPVVAAGLAAALRVALPDRVRFFCGYDLISTACVDDALARASGLFLNRDIEEGYGLAGKLPVSGLDSAGEGGRLHQGPGIGFFPSVKPLRGAFDIELSVFHDLSTLVMPLMHIRGNVVHHMEAIMADLASDDLVVAVSEACKSDLVAYLGVDAARIVTAPNGVAWPDWYESAALNLAGAGGGAGVEPYFLVLGTREPRKNIMKVFDLLEYAPALLETHRFVFAGKMGWLEEQHALPRSLEPHVASGRILFPGFIGEFEKYTLLRFAQATLYPSLFEGFGLPVLESLSVGTPCVASWSSSIPEVGGDVCAYFDPLSAGDFARALDGLMSRRGPALEAACRARAARFTWRAALGRILERLLGHPALA
jgi:glycosyltransferase involved in cell wall biosynthesis